MNKISIDFLNWQPDQEPQFAEGGLETITNAYHTESGWKLVKNVTQGAISTATALGYTTMISAAAVPFAASSDNIAIAVINADTTTTSALRIGVVGETLPFTSVSFATMVSLTAAKFRSFSIAELDQQAVITAVVDVSLLSGGFTTYSLSGNFGYTLTSI